MSFVLGVRRILKYAHRIDFLGTVKYAAVEHSHVLILKHPGTRVPGMTGKYRLVARG